MRALFLLPLFLVVLLPLGCKKKHHDVGVDLVVNSVVVTPTAPTSDDTITVDFLVVNRGPNAVANVVWQVRAEDQVLGTGTIASLAGHAGEAATVSFHALEPGAHTLFLTVDPNHTISEDDEGDNDTAVPITIAAAPPHFDLLFSGAVTVDPASPTSSDATVRFAILNNDTTGGGVAATNVHWHIYDNGVSIGSNTIASIPANGVQNQSFLLTGTAGGTAGVHHLSIVIDPHHAITESDETNNTATVDPVIAPAASG